MVSRLISSRCLRTVPCCPVKTHSGVRLFRLSWYLLVLSWMTVPDSAIKTAQVASLKEQREEEALQAASKKEDEAAKKREAELDALTKKKDEAEKKKFKKGQADLEKELGF